MFVRVVAEIAAHTSHLRRRTQDASVIVIVEHGAATLHDAIERARDAHAEAVHAARQRLLARRFDEQVNVIALHRVMYEPQSEAVGAGEERTLQSAEQPAPA